MARLSGDKPGSRLFFFHITATFTARDSGSIGLCVVMRTRPFLYGLLCDFCSSVREFARQHFFTDIRLPSDSTSRWTPPPCLRLTLPTAERVVVFHHLAVAHAGRTHKKCLCSAKQSKDIFSIKSVFRTRYGSSRYGRGLRGCGRASLHRCPSCRYRRRHGLRQAP